MPTSEITHTITRAPAPDGPFFVVTAKDGVVTNVTTGIGPDSLVGVSAALDQCKSDASSALSGLTYKSTEITTLATS